MRERRLLSGILALLMGAGGARAGPDTECLVGLDLDGLSVTSDARRFHATCIDCDPLCDHDGVAKPNGVCTFALRACVNETGDPACAPAVVRRLRIRPRHVSLSRPALPSDVAPSCGPEWSLLDVRAGPDVNTSGRRLVVMARTQPGGGRRDVDRYRFTCAPRAPDDACPLAAPVCGDGVIAAPEQCDPGAAADGCAESSVCRSGGANACHCTPCTVPGPSTHTLVLATRGAPSSCALPASGASSAGEVRDADEDVLARLAPSCLYAGGPFASLVARSEAGARRAYTVTAPTGCLAGQLALGPSSASGGFLSAGCTEPGCLFIAPLPVFNTALSSCIVPRIVGAIRGALDVDRGDLTLEVPLALDVHLTTAEIHPCPICDDGTCVGGGAEGLTCEASDPFSCPIGGTLLGTIPLTLSLATTATTSRADDGLFCAGQAAAGALGYPAARDITVRGTGTAGSLVAGTPFDLALAGQACVPTSGVPILDGTSGLPGPGAWTLPVRGWLD